MLSKNNNICFFPTKTVFIDDCLDFLDSITLNIDFEKHSYKFFSNTFQAIEYIEKNIKHNSWYKKYLSHLEEEEADKKLLEVNFSELHTQIFNQERFNVITSIVVDYDMPTINGLELCHKIKNLPVQKILLTGAANEKLAVDAFNSGLIDYFIEKHNPNIYEILNHQIKMSEIDYFKNISDLFISCGYNKKEQDLFINDAFRLFFSKHLKNHKIIEFYQLESDGSYILFDEDGNLSLLFLKLLEDLQKLNEYSSAENLFTITDISKNEISYFLKYPFLSNKKNNSKTPEELKVITINNLSYIYLYKKNIQLNKPILQFGQVLR